MKQVHVECYPDEALVKILGYTRRNITHHSGKSRVFKRIGQANEELALVDEDPGSAKSGYERSLRFVEESYGIKTYIDSSSNKIVMLSGNIEDWIISLCKAAKVRTTDFGLPDKAKDLHSVIHHSLPKFEELLNHLLQTDNPGLNQLKKILK